MPAAKGAAVDGLVFITDSWVKANPRALNAWMALRAGSTLSSTRRV